LKRKKRTAKINLLVEDKKKNRWQLFIFRSQLTIAADLVEKAGQHQFIHKESLNNQVVLVIQAKNLISLFPKNQLAAN